MPACFRDDTGVAEIVIAALALFAVTQASALAHTAGRPIAERFQGPLAEKKQR
jgi:hypothetical protein